MLEPLAGAGVSSGGSGDNLPPSCLERLQSLNSMSELTSSVSHYHTQIDAFTRSHQKMLQSLYWSEAPSEDAGRKVELEELWTLLEAYIASFPSLVRLRMKAQRSRYLEPWIAQGVSRSWHPRCHSISRGKGHKARVLIAWFLPAPASIWPPEADPQAAIQRGRGRAGRDPAHAGRRAEPRREGLRVRLHPPPSPAHGRRARGRDAVVSSLLLVPPPPLRHPRSRGPDLGGLEARVLTAECGVGAWEGVRCGGAGEQAGPLETAPRPTQDPL